MSFKSVTASLSGSNVPVDSMSGAWDVVLQSPGGYTKFVSAVVRYNGDGSGTATAGDVLVADAPAAAGDPTVTWVGTYRNVTISGRLVVAGTLPSHVSLVVDMVWATVDEDVSSVTYSGTVSN